MTLLGPSHSVLPCPSYLLDMTKRSKSDSMMVRWVPICSTSSSESYMLLCTLTNPASRSSLLVDSNKALHARLTQSTVPVLIADTSSGSSHSLELYTPISDITYNPVNHLPRPPNPPPPGPRSSAGSPQPQPGRKKKKKRQKEVHVTLRRGGR